MGTFHTSERRFDLSNSERTPIKKQHQRRVRVSIALLRADFDMNTISNPSITKQGYFELRSQLDFQRRFWPTAIILALDVTLLVVACSVVRGSFLQSNPLVSWPAYLLGQSLLVLVMFHSFAVLHECGHGTCSRHEWLNTTIGHVASLFCFMPYFPWKYIHSSHHIWTGNVERDPTLRLVRNYQKSQRAKNLAIRIAWRTWIPLLAFFQHVVFWTYPAVLSREGRLHGKRLYGSVFSIALLVGVYAGLAVYCSSWFNIKTIGPAVFVYLVIVELINFPHHMGTQIFANTRNEKKLPLWQHNLVTRSCYYPRFIAKWFLLNFNFHVEHHLFPDLPWYHLAHARPIAKETLQNSYLESIGIEWNLQNRAKDPTEVFLVDQNGQDSHWNVRHHHLERVEDGSFHSDAQYEQFLRDVRIAASELSNEIHEPSRHSCTNPSECEPSDRRS